MDKHPEIIYVTLVEDADGDLYPTASDSPSDFESGDVVGIYELKERKALEEIT